MATLPVVPCQTSFAVTPSPTVVPLPTSVVVSVPAGDAAGLAVYSDDAGFMMLMGPAAWTCHGLYGADGSGGLLISPGGESVPSDPDPGWHLSTSSSDEAIVGYETGGEPGARGAAGVPVVPVGGGDDEAGSRSGLRRDTSLAGNRHRCDAATTVAGTAESEVSSRTRPASPVTAFRRVD